MLCGYRVQTTLQSQLRLRLPISLKKKVSIRRKWDVRSSWREPGSGKKSTAERSRSSLRNLVYPVTGTASVLPWTKDALRLLKKYLSIFIRRDTFIRDPESSTGVRYVRLLCQTQRLSMRSRMDISGISSIRS